MSALSFKDRGAARLMVHCEAIDADRVVQDSGEDEGAYHCRQLCCISEALQIVQRDKGMPDYDVRIKPEIRLLTDSNKQLITGLMHPHIMTLKLEISIL